MGGLRRADATDGDLLISFFERKKKERVENNNMRMAVSAVGGVNPTDDV